MNPLSMVMADLRAMRGAALLSVILIALAVAIGVAISAQERALRQASARAADDFPLVVGAPGSATQLVMTSVYLQLEALPLTDGALLQKLGADARVSGVAPIAFGDVIQGYPVVGTVAEFVTRWGRVTLSEGRNFTAENEAVIGADVNLTLGQSVTPSHGTGAHLTPGKADDDEETHRHHGVNYTIVGRLPRLGTPWDRAILVPVEQVWEAHGLERGHQSDERIGAPFDSPAMAGIPALIIRPKQVADAYQLRAELRKSGLLAVFPAEILVDLYQRAGDVKSVMLVASLLNNLLVFLAIVMLLVTVISLRRRRYAVLRALGASRSFVALTIWLGATLLLSGGALLGLMLGFAAAKGVAMLFGQQVGLQLAVGLGWHEVQLVLAMVMVGGAMALLPALLGWRRPLVADLRS